MAMVWVGFWILTILLLAGLVLGVASLASGRSSAADTLGERLARGEVTAEEYRERLELLRAGGAGSSRIRWVAAGLALVAIAGLVLLAATLDSDDMGGMMDGGMGGMGAMMATMMGGDTRRIGPAPSPGASEVLVEGRELYFSPSELRIQAGETVNLTFVNEGHMAHTFTVPELGIDLRVRPGDRVTAALESPEAGSYEFICTVPGHEDGGMRGEIVVAGG